MLSPIQLIRALFVSPAGQPSDGELELARLLQVPVSELPAIRLGPRYHYRPFSIAKRDGRVRVPDRIRNQALKLKWLAWWKRDEETLARLRGYEAFLSTRGLKP